MGRPKRPFNGMNDILSNEDEYLEELLGVQLGTRRRIRWTSGVSASYPTPNGTQDPLTYYLILDALMRMDTDIELRAGILAEWLSENREHLAWDPYTVGKVLADLCDAFETVLGAKNGLLERGRDSRGSFYRLHQNQGTAGAAWLLRDDLYSLVQAEIAVRRAGGKTDTLGSPLLECPSVRGEFPA